MTLVEALTAAVVFATGASASLQLSGRSAQVVHSAEQLQQRQEQLEQRLLAVEAELQQLAGTPVAADCATAAAWLMARIPELQPADQGLRLQLVLEGAPPRERWYDPAALGLCPPEGSHGTP